MCIESEESNTYDGVSRAASGTEPLADTYDILCAVKSYDSLLQHVLRFTMQNKVVKGTNITSQNYCCIDRHLDYKEFHNA